MLKIIFKKLIKKNILNVPYRFFVDVYLYIQKTRYCIHVREKLIGQKSFILVAVSSPKQHNISHVIFMSTYQREKETERERERKKNRFQLLTHVLSGKLVVGVTVIFLRLFDLKIDYLLGGVSGGQGMDEAKKSAQFETTQKRHLCWWLSLVLQHSKILSIWNFLLDLIVDANLGTCFLPIIYLKK